MDTTTKADIYLYIYILCTCNVVQKVTICFNKYGMSWCQRHMNYLQLVQILISLIYQARYLSPANKGKEQVFPFLPFFAFPYTPENSPLEAENDLFKKEISFCRVQFSRFHVSFRECKCERMRAQFDFVFEVISFGIALALLFLAVMVWWQVGDGE